jgi:branched-chain amino acid transport system ATP-binding protein
MTAPLLRSTNVTMRFGGLIALNALDLEIAAGEIHAVIGPNGSGKTTLLNSISGAYRPQAGSIHLDGIELLGLRPNRIAALGLARTFQSIRLFGSLTVLENVMVAAGRLNRAGLAAILAGSAGARRAEQAIEARAQDALMLVGLGERAAEPARALPYAQQRLLEIARAVASEPRLLLLDEPAAGMNMTEAMQLVELVQRLRRRSLTVLLVEHNMRLVMGISDQITVLDFGRKIAQGTAADIRRHPVVIEAYLGRPRRA